ncbi:hypothetical protein AABH04_004591 [Salmonella enterica]|nr:hypothetical protein [Salmonella enterica]ECC5600732.1 hypothetical protein [Salmonella enterica]EEK3280106.1 hypothetical protein [Salmonella enterica]EEK9427225.1 hypothetical protein [Salmonella enterica]EFQ5401933.1 hypothetical protein [Salmonella enterica]
MLLFKCKNKIKISHLLTLSNINYSVMCSGEGIHQEISNIICWVGNMEDVVEYLTNYTFIITSECSEALLAASVVFANGINIDGVLITNEGDLSSRNINFCTKLMCDEKLLVLFCNTSYEEVCIKLNQISVYEESENSFVIQNSIGCIYTENT